METFPRKGSEDAQELHIFTDVTSYSRLRNVTNDRDDDDDNIYIYIFMIISNVESFSELRS